MDRLTLLTAHDPEPARASRCSVDRSRWMDDLPWRYIFLIQVHQCLRIFVSQSA